MIKTSTYTSSDNSTVTLCTNTITKLKFTVCNNDITLFDDQGDMLCGCKTLEAAIKFINNEDE